MITLSSGGATDTGPVREHNEDAMLVAEPVFLVADGMGGHAAGEVASALAVAAFAGLGGRPCRAEDVVAAVSQANDAITAGQQSPGQQGMGTTLAGLTLVEHDGDALWLVCHVGDSRVYRYADGSLAQLTRDHTEVQELIDAGVVAEADRDRHPRAHVLTRALGMMPAPEPDCKLFWPEAGERFLICSDGLSGTLDDTEIEAVLATPASAAEAAQALVTAAVAAAATDNITCVVVDTLEARPGGVAGESVS